MQAAERLKQRGREREDFPRSVMRAAITLNPYISPYITLPHYPSAKRISVENLLVWAYQVEMVHIARPEGLAGEAVSIRSDRSVLSGSGSDCRVDVVDSSSNLGFAAKADAYRVHDAVTGLASVDVELPRDCVGEVDTRRMARGEVPELAGAVLVRRSQLVMNSAIDGHAPDWIMEPAIKVERGEVICERSRSGRILRDRAGRPRELVQLVRFVGDMPWHVARARLVYREWALALRVLRVQLRDVLRTYVLEDDVPALEPWTRKT
jgi:hypothetical protein